MTTNVLRQTGPRLHNYLEIGQNPWCLTSYPEVIPLYDTGPTGSLIRHSQGLNSSSAIGWVTLGTLFSLSGFQQAYLWMVITCRTCKVVVRTRACDLCSCKGPCAEKDPPSGLMLWSITNELKPEDENSVTGKECNTSTIRVTAAEVLVTRIFK